MELQSNKFQQERPIALPGQLFQGTGNNDVGGQV